MKSKVIKFFVLVFAVSAVAFMSISVRAADDGKKTAPSGIGGCCS